MSQVVQSTTPNRVPEVTIDFWLIKLMAVTMGETAADYLAVNLGLGLTTTSLLMVAVLAAALAFQFRQKRYVPWTYWLAVVLISVVGTLVTDNLVDNLGVPLLATTVAFAIALAVTFLAWFRSEGTLSIHSITTGRREAFYWLAILFTFALGTAAGDLVAEQFALGYFSTGILFGLIIASLAIGYFFLGLDPIIGFWLAYIFTRPLGASFGDLLSQPSEYGGFGLGTVLTSAVFLAAIVAIVGYATSYSAGRLLPEVPAAPGSGVGKGFPAPHFAPPSGSPTGSIRRPEARLNDGESPEPRHARRVRYERGGETTDSRLRIMSPIRVRRSDAAGG